uniref:Uncharacterized protein n=1 Tax=Arion vulgaris TaxID=1028688 RepID=A0A0B7AYZ9_9EUPU
MVMKIISAYRALSWVVEQQTTYTIVSDSMNMLRRIESGSLSGMGGQHSEVISQEIDLGGHAGWSTGVMNFLTNNSLTHAGRSMDRADVINAVRAHL